MSFEQYQADFDRDGFVVLRKFLNDDQLAELQDNLDRYIREVVPGLTAEHAFYVDRERPETLKQLQHMDVDPYFRDYAKHPTWNAMAEALLGEPVEAQAPEWFNKPAGTDHPTPPHQDNYYFCLRPPQVLTAWLALDRVDAENGGLIYVPGSHKRGLRPHDASSLVGFSQSIADYGPDDERVEQPVRLDVGDLIVHHGETIHRARPNRSPTRHRRAFAMVLKATSCRRDEEAYRRYEQALKAQHASLNLTG